MASFVREILSATGHLGEKEDLCAKASRLKGRVNELKVRNIPSRGSVFINGVKNDMLWFVWTRRIKLLIINCIIGRTIMQN